MPWFRVVWSRPDGGITVEFMARARTMNDAIEGTRGFIRPIGWVPRATPIIWEEH